jgi:hypothetical protein
VLRQILENSSPQSLPTTILFKMNGFTVISLIAILLSRLALSQPLVIDSVKSVSYKGFTSTPATITSPGIDTFLNIPYGQDTAGKNRFAPSKVYIPHAGQVFDATIAGPSCPQSSAAPLLYQTLVTGIPRIV